MNLKLEVVLGSYGVMVKLGVWRLRINLCSILVSEIPRNFSICE